MTDTTEPSPDELPWKTAPEWLGEKMGQLEFTNEAEERAEQLAHKYGIALSIGTPKCVAAAAAYLAGLEVNEKRRQETVADVFEVSKQAIRENYREMAEREGYELRKEQTDTEPRGGFVQRVREVLRI